MFGVADRSTDEPSSSSTSLRAVRTRGESVWISCRDDNRVQVYDTHTRELQASLAVDAPSGIFFTARAQRMGF